MKQKKLITQGDFDELHQQTKGKFITVEGVDGAGKSTLVKQLAEFLDEKGCDVVTTREPYNSWMRDMAEWSLTDEWTELYSFMADRHHHCRNFIAPKLEEGNIVICDRFSDSTLAYQSVALENHFPTRNHAHEFIKRLVDCEPLVPDLTLHIDVDPDISLERTDQSSDYEEINFQHEVYSQYQRVIREAGSRTCVVNGMQSQDKVVEDAEKIIVRRVL